MAWSAVEIGGANVNSGYGPDNGHIAAGLYAAAVRDFGPGGYRPPEIAAKPEELRHVTDAEEVGGLALQLEPALGPPQGGVAPRVADSRIAATRRGGCTTVSKGTLAEQDAAEPHAVEFVLPPGGAWLSLSRPVGSSVFLGRFADETTVPITRPVGARDLELRIPPDQASVPWRLLVRSRSPFSVCGLAGEAEG
jgi:hypothetical protein